MGIATHTPGPWKLETVTTSCGICHKIGEFKRGTKITSACVYDDYGSPDNPESQALLANARLMATAPNLLAALRALSVAADNLDPQSGVPIGYQALLDAATIADAAIAKATGVAA